MKIINERLIQSALNLAQPSVNMILRVQDLIWGPRSELFQDLRMKVVKPVSGLPASQLGDLFV